MRVVLVRARLLRARSGRCRSARTQAGPSKCRVCRRRVRCRRCSRAPAQVRSAQRECRGKNSRCASRSALSGLLLMRRPSRSRVPPQRRSACNPRRPDDRPPSACCAVARAVGARSQPEPVSFSSHVRARDRHHAASVKVLRARLREAATRLVDEPGKVLDIAFDSGFGDVSNFNRAFRTEFGVSPRGFRQQCQ